MCCRYYIEETNEMQAIVSDMMRSSLVRKWNELKDILLPYYVKGRFPVGDTMELKIGPYLM